MAEKQEPRSIESRLLDELVRVRREGLTSWRHRVQRLEVLDWITRRASDQDSKADRLDVVFGRACDLLGDVYGPIAKALYGVGVAPVKSGPRTQLAWEMFRKAQEDGQTNGREISEGSFRSREVDEIKQSLCRALLEVARTPAPR
jgi:hypothetical protein